MLVTIKEGKQFRQKSGKFVRTVTCKCDCGNVSDIQLYYLVRTETTTHCGCKIKKKKRDYNKRYFNYKLHLEYKSNAKKLKKLYCELEKMCADEKPNLKKLLMSRIDSLIDTQISIYDDANKVISITSKERRTLSFRDKIHKFNIEYKARQTSVHLTHD